MTSLRLCSVLGGESLYNLSREKTIVFYVSCFEGRGTGDGRRRDQGRFCFGGVSNVLWLNLICMPKHHSGLS